MVEPGRTCLGDRYELGTLIAAGGMGQVWRGHDVVLGRSVAVKVLRSEYTGDPTFLARFRAEAQNAAALSHPHIAAVYDYGETIAQDGSGETLAYLVMELVEGEPLSAVLRRGALDPETTLRILGQTAAGLGEAHRAGMVHRDVKPANLLVCPDGDVKITDFGIAWSARSVALTGTGQIIGTPQYLSPEQAEGRQATPASDVYALGLIGYECLTGRPAFDGENAVTIALKQVRDEPEPLPAALPVRVRTLIRRALAKDPAARMVDGAAFAAAVEAVRAGRPIDDEPPTRAVAAVAVAGATASGRGPGRAVAVRHRGPGRGRPTGRRRARLSVVLLPLIGLLAGAGVAAMVLQGLAGNGTPPAAEAAQQRDGAPIVLVEADYVGRPADEVAVQLAALGLTVRREVEESPNAEPGTVVGVEPAGEALSEGDTVILQVAAAPGSGAGGSGGAAGDGAAGTAAAESSDAAGSPDPAAGDGGTGSGEPSTGEAPADGTGELPGEQPTGEEPVEEPAAEEPVVEEPTDEEPTDEEPVVEEPTDEEPVVEEPTDEEPVEEGGTEPATPATTTAAAATRS